MQMDDEARQLVRRMAMALHPYARAALDAQAEAMKADPPRDGKLDRDGETAFGETSDACTNICQHSKRRSVK